MLISFTKNEEVPTSVFLLIIQIMPTRGLNDLGVVFVNKFSVGDYVYYITKRTFLSLGSTLEFANPVMF